MFNINFNYTIAVDSLAITLIILSTSNLFMCFLTETIQYRQRYFFVLLFITEFALINVFSVIEIFYNFYFLFEAY